MVALDQPGGHDSDHALVPLLSREHVAPPLLLRLRPRLDFLNSLAEDSFFDRLPVAVQLVETMSEPGRLVAVLRQQQLERRLRMAEPPGRVQPRRKTKTDRGRVDCGRIDPGDLHQLAQTGFLRARERPQPRDRQAAVLIHERNDVGDRRDSNQVEMPQQRLRVGAEESLAELEDDSGAAELAERVRGLAIRPDEWAVGQLLGRAVVIADDDLEAERLGRRDFGARRDPAVDGQDKTAAVAGQARERLFANAVALVEAAGQMPVDVGPELAQDQDGQGGCADPVRVVVAVNADAPPLGNRGANRLTRSGHVPEAERVVRRQRSLEEPARAGHIFVATPDEHGRRRRAERELTSERRDGVALTWFDRPGALVHGQSTLGSAPDGTRAGFSSCGRNRCCRQQTAHFRYEGVACDADQKRSGDSLPRPLIPASRAVAGPHRASGA